MNNLFILLINRPFGSVLILIISNIILFLFLLFFPNHKIQKIKKENKNLEKKLLEQTEQISQLYKFASFGKLAAGIFHDLINPLSAVASNVYILEDNSKENYAKNKACIARAIRASRRMEKFISCAKKQLCSEYHSSIFCLNKEVKEVISLLNHKILSEKISIELVTPTKIFTYGNPIKFQQIITNLLSNSIDSYSDIKKENKENKIKIFLSKKHTRAFIKIIDEGAGIPKEFMKNIFDPFFTTKAAKSIGIGLSTIKEIIEQDFKGKISIKSTPKQGTIARVVIPLFKKTSPRKS